MVDHFNYLNYILLNMLQNSDFRFRKILKKLKPSTTNRKEKYNTYQWTHKLEKYKEDAESI